MLFGKEKIRLNCGDYVLMAKSGEVNFFDRVYEFVSKIPYGRVATYGQVARACGSPRSSRAVGYALHVNPMPGIIPCHRVVNREGRLAPGFAFGGPEIQKDLLKKEGVFVEKRPDHMYYVDLGRYGILSFESFEK